MTDVPTHRWSVSPIRTLRVGGSRDEDMSWTGNVLGAPSMAEHWRAEARLCRLAADAVEQMPRVMTREERLAVIEYLIDPFDRARHAKMLGACEELRTTAQQWDALAERQAQLAKRGRRGGGGPGFGRPVDAHRAHAVLRHLHAAIMAMLTNEEGAGLVYTAGEPMSKLPSPAAHEDEAERVARIFDFADDAARAEFLRRARAALARVVERRDAAKAAREILRDIVGDLDASGFGVPRISAAAERDDRTWLRILHPRKTPEGDPPDAT